jgi:uncharacterized protein YjgD (DUF1641 family)
MSSEMERFAEDLEKSESLFRELAEFRGTHDELAAWLNARGYRIDAAQLAEILSAAAEELADEDLESVSGGTGEMVSLELRIPMDRRSKFISTLSQMMKKISSTQDTLTQNIK